MFLSNLIFLILVITIIIFEITRRKFYYFDTIFFFNVWFTLAFILAPFLIINFGSDFAHRSFYVKPEVGYLAPTITIGIFYFSVLIGTKINIGFSGKINIRSKKYPLKYYYKLAFILFAIGILSTIILISRYGGITFFIENVNTIRNGKVERNTGAAFIGLFSIYVSYSYYLILSIFLIYKKKKVKLKKLPVILIFLFVITIGVASIRGSREGLLEIFLISYLITVFITKKYYLRYIVLGIPLFVFFILYGKEFFSSYSFDMSETFKTIRYVASQNDALQSFKNFTHNFAHPFMSLNQAINITGTTIDLRFFLDIPYSFIFYLQLFGYDAPDTITYINTFYAIGRFESNIPPGIIALLWYNLKIFGVFIGGITFGYLLRLTNDLFKQLTQDNRPLSILVYILSASTLGHFIFVGDLRVSIIQNFSMAIIVFIYILTHVRIIKKV